MNLTVIIPTLNNFKGLKYLLNYFKDKNYQIIVVDNKSTIIGLDPRRSLPSTPIGGGDDTENLVYLPQEKNLGFAGGVNLGARDVETKWMLVLNDDIEFEDKLLNLKYQLLNKFQILNIKKEKQNVIESLIQFAEENKLDAVSPILRNPDGKVENYGYKILPFGKVETLNTKYEILDTKIDGLTAACLLIRTEMFKKLGGFDESFFAYLEDIDFFLRMKNYKFGIAYEIEVLHNHMTTAKTMGNFKAKQDMVNWWRLFFKHPDKFKFNLEFVAERLRNVSGYLKTTFKSI